MSSTDLEISDRPEAFGPAMRALGDRQREWVLRYISNGGNGPEAAISIGCTPGNTAYIYSSRNSRDPKVLDAIREEAEKRIKVGAVMAMDVMLEIMNNPTHKDRFKAAQEVANRSGLIVVAKSEVAHTHTDTTDAMIARITNLSKQLGLDPQKLLGSVGVITDAEFVEVTPRAAEPEEW
jgi:phage terminase small subunit